MKTDEQLKIAIDRHANAVKRVCMMYLKNAHDTDDVFQEVFLKYAQSKTEFSSLEHEKAWILRVTMNACKDHLRNHWRSRVGFLGEHVELLEDAPSERSDVLVALRKLPDKHRDAIYLHYYEGYNAEEIAQMLESKPNTVYSYLSRGRKKLKHLLGGEFHGE